MIFLRQTALYFAEKRFVQVSATPLWEKRGMPLYASPYEPGKTWLPGWAYELFHGVCGARPQNTSFEEELARLSAAAIRSDDPSAFVETVLAAYALGGWRAALALAGAQDEAHAAGPA